MCLFACTHATIGDKPDFQTRDHGLLFHVLQTIELAKRMAGLPFVRSRIIGFASFTCVLFSGDALAQRPRVVPPGADPSGNTQQLPAAPPAPKAGAVGKTEPAKDGPALIAGLKVHNKAVMHRLRHRMVNGKWINHPMPAGAAGMNLFSECDHENKSYTRNPDLWAQDLVRQLTGVSIYNDFTQESYGGVLITPRHLLFCAHAHPHAHQTWGPNPNRPGATHRFLTSDGRVVESLQLHQAKSFGNSLLPGLKSVDLCVALMDRDLEADGLAVAPIFPPVSDAAVTSALEWARQEKQPFSFIGISQGTSRPTPVEPPEPVADYPRKHGRMCYLLDRNHLPTSGGTTGPFAPWSYRVWDGDSGTPAFLIFEGVPHLWMILTAAPGNGPRPGSHIAHLEALIAAADENAIQLGRLDQPTGLKPRVGKLRY